MNRAIYLFLFVLVILSGESFTGPEKKAAETIKWYTFQQAVELNKKNPKKIFIDVYTEWCGWCKRMDATTYSDPVISKNMNKYFYAVKMDAEMKDSINFQGVAFVNPSPAPRSTHQLAYSLLNGQLSYPTSVLLDEKFSMIQPIPGYMNSETLEPILVYIGQNKNKDIKWEDFKKTFKSELKPVDKTEKKPG